MGRQSDGDKWFESHLRALGYSVLGLAKMSDLAQNPDMVLDEVRFKLDADNRTSVLVVLKAHRGGDSLVGFVGAPDLATAVLAVSKKLAAGRVKWREDRPWEER